MKDYAFAVSLGLVIGAVCRAVDIPLPAPPRPLGAFLVVAMTLGFIAGGTLLGGGTP